MKIKKLIAMGLTAAMVAGMAAPVFAEEAADPQHSSTD